MNAVVGLTNCTQKNVLCGVARVGGAVQKYRLQAKRFPFESLKKNRFHAM